MNKILDNLILGSYEGVQSIKTTQPNKFVACLTVGKEFIINNVEEINFHSYDKIVLPDLNLVGIEHKIIPIDDGVDDIIVSVLPEAISFIDKHINNGEVYVHCLAGVSRSPSIVYAYMLSKGWDPVKAFEELTSKRTQVYPYDIFIFEILKYFGFSKDKVLKEIRSGLYDPDR